MRVLYFHQHFSTPKGAAGIRSFEMAQRLLSRGHQVTMVCGSFGIASTGLEMPFRNGVRRGTVMGIDVVEFDLAYSNRDGFITRSFTFLKFAARSSWFALTENYDVVFATTTPLTAGIPGILARWLRGKPFVFEVRDLWPELPKAMGVIKNPVVLAVMSILEYVSYHSAHRLIGLSSGIVDGIAQRGIDRHKIKLISNGCDLDIFGSPVEPWRPENIGADDLLAIFAGTLGIANGLDKVLDGAAELQKRNRQDIKILLIGDGKLKTALQRRAERTGLVNVIFHPPVNKHLLARVMAASDIGLQILANVKAFYFGTSPNKFFDYIAAGKPVLNNYPGWVAQLIEENRCGYVIPPDDAEKFADALEHAAANREHLVVMGSAARRLAESRFDRYKLADEWVDWLEKAVNDHGT